MKEIWTSVAGYEGLYEVSSEGKVRSLSGGKRKGGVLIPRKDRSGYYYVGLYKSLRTKSVKVHRLVATAFVDNEQSKPSVNHINGKKLDNRSENLQWVTNKENTHHAIKNGLWNPSLASKNVKNRVRKVTEKQILEILRYLKRGVTSKFIEERYKISRSAVYEIKYGNSHKHVNVPKELRFERPK